MLSCVFLVSACLPLSGDDNIQETEPIAGGGMLMPAGSTPTVIPGHEHVDWSVLPDGWSVFTNANRVRHMVFDHQGYLWTAGPSGVVRWDVEKHTYQHYTIFDGLPGNNITALVVSPVGTVWVGGGNRLAYFEDGKWNVIEEYNYSVIDKPGWGRERFVLIGEKDFLSSPIFIGFNDMGGVEWLIIDGLYIYKDGIFEGVKGSFFGGTFSYFLGLEGLNGTIWSGVSGCCAATKPKGYAFDGENLLNYSQLDYINSAAQTPDGKYWFGVYSEDRRTSTIISFDGPVWNLDTGLVGRGVKTGPSGDLWYITENGITRFDGEKVVLEIVLPFDSSWYTFEIGPDDTPWVAFDDWHDPQGVWNYTGNHWEQYKIENQVPSMGLEDLDIGPDGAIWVLGDTSIFRFDGKVWRSFPINSFPELDNTKFIICMDYEPHLIGNKWGHSGYYVGSLNGDLVEKDSFECGRKKINRLEDPIELEDGTKVWVFPDGTRWRYNYAFDVPLQSFEGGRWVEHEVVTIFDGPDLMTSDGAVWFFNPDYIYRYKFPVDSQ